MRTAGSRRIHIADMRVGEHMKVKVTPTEEVRILSLDERKLENIFWCAMSYRADRLLWADGYLLCMENYEEAMSHEIEKGVFPISQICYAVFPKYMKYYEVEKSVQIPIVNVSDMHLYKAIVKAIKDREAAKLAEDTD